MPLLFAVTLFVSASLLFMIQPMVGKMVLPLLGGSPAVWNACMVFFQALLLLGYLYAHKLSDIQNPRKQWMIHLLVLAGPLTAFAAAAVFGARHTPIAILEALAPTDNIPPIVSVLLILTVAIGVPFFVISTTATLLQKWFVFTGHPSARDPYFLYSASNFGSLISLLGYPLLIEPRMTIDAQAWVFAVGFATLVGLIYFCGRAAANPIGVPPPPRQESASRSPESAGKGQTPDAGLPTPSSGEPPPTLARKLKWILLAFVPSTLMLGVTFHMTTDIASVPLLWVGPLALYLITFIIAFGRVPDWFRMVIGNLAPVMILLLVFVLISGVDPGYGVKLILHMLTFFAAALMCHYELARDRPAPQYLTGFFLLMSVGGVLGGIFNSLVAPLIFPHPYEYPIALIIACLMVPKLLEDKDAEPEPPGSMPESAADWLTFVAAIANVALLAVVGIWLFTHATQPLRPFGDGSVTLGVKPVLNTLVGMFCVGLLSVVGVELYGRQKLKQAGLACELWGRLPMPLRVVLMIVVNPLALPWATTKVVQTAPRFGRYLDFVVPIFVGLAFFGLCLVPSTEWFDDTTKTISKTISLTEGTIKVVMIFAVPVMLCFFFVDRPTRFALCVAAILAPLTVRESNAGLIHSERSFFGILKISESDFVSALRSPRNKDFVFRYETGPNAGKEMVAMQFKMRQLHHGTTLHGTQYAYFTKPNDDNTVVIAPGAKDDEVLKSRHILDDFQMIWPNVSPWEAIVTTATIHAYDIREEPLTYYHQTGPVGAMFAELWRRKGGADAKAPFAMIGLGTGSVSCYARPGQSMTFYEIDPAVKKLVADTREYFSYVKDAEKRKANVKFLMGDARLKLKEATDEKYALLLVDAFSSDSIPVHLLTVEAVKLYMDRITEDGIFALHISNRWLNLEPVVARIAGELGLTARVWNDNSEGRRGKTASSWVVLARDPKHLGELYSPIGDLVFGPKPTTVGADDRLQLDMSNQLAQGLRVEFDELYAKGTSGKPKYEEMDKLPGDESKAAWLAWTREKLSKTTDPAVKARLELYITLMDKYKPHDSFQEVMYKEHGHAFRRLETMSRVPAWTDDYADVMGVMTIAEVQKVREFFGLTNPLKRHNPE